MASQQKTNDELLLLSFNAIPIGVLVLDRAGRVVFANKPFISLFSPDKISSPNQKSFQDFINEIELIKLIENLLLHKKSFDKIFELRALDPTKKYFRCRGNVITESKESLTFIILIGDITEQKQQQILQQAIYKIAQTASTSHNLSELFLEIHKIIKTVMYAENFYIALSQENDELITFPYFKDTSEQAAAARKKGKGLTEYVLKTGKPLLCDNALNKKLEKQNKTKIIGAPSAIWLGVPLIANEKTIGVMAVQHYSDPLAYTIEDQRMLEFVSTQVAKAILQKQNEESLYMWAHIFENAKWGIALCNENNNTFELMNTTFAKIHGFSVEELTNKSIYAVFDAKDYHQVSTHLQKSSSEGNCTFEIVRKRKDNSLFPSLNNLTVVKDENGDIIQRVINVMDISEIKMVQDNLVESEERYRSLTETSPNAIVIHSGGKFEYVNAEAVRLFGAEHYSQLIGKKIIDFVHDDYKPIHKERVQTIYKKKWRVPFVEQKLVRLDGTHVVVEVGGAPINYKGKIASQAVLRDITERKKNENALKKIAEAISPVSGQEFFRILVTYLAETLEMDYAFVGSLSQQNPQVIDTMAVYAHGELSNNISYDLSGAPCENVVGKTCAVYPENVQLLFPEDHLLVELGVDSYIGVPLFETAGKATGLCVVMHSKPMHNVEHVKSVLTIFAHRASVELERQKIIHNLKESENQFRTLVEQAPFSMVVFSPDGRPRLVNKAFKKLWHASDEIVSDYLEKFNILKDNQVLQAGIMPIVERGFNGETVTMPEMEYDPNLNRGPEETTLRKIIGRGYIYPVKDEEGAVRDVVMVQEDVTQQRLMEQERSNLEKQLQHTQKLKSLGVLAGGIAHDFNNILMTILGNADLALLELSPLSGAKQSILEIQNAAQRAAELAKQMLAYSGKGKFVVEFVGINELIKEMVTMLEVSISKKCLLKFNFKPDLPTFEADVTQIRQVVMNLITNASEAIGDQEGVINITTGVQTCDKKYLESCYLPETIKEGDYLFFEVNDSGSGMSQETKEKLFDPFFTTKFTGRGLGLSAVLGIVRGHKGAIRIESNIGEGTSFQVLFPVKENNSAQKKKKTTNKNALKDNAKGTILIAEDEESVLLVAKIMLENLGYTIITAVDGRDALEKYKISVDKIDLVLMDLTMPHMDGVQASNALREITPNLKIIISSGYNELEVVERFNEQKPAGFIQKPFRLEDLANLVKSVMKQS
jgi:PAS domain S-box-containing protein